MRKLAIYIVSGILLGATQAGRSAAQETRVPNKLSASAELVLVPAVARKSGLHLAGLKKEDFILMQDGVRQEISVFEEVHTVAPPPITGTSTGEFTNAKNSERSERLTIIAIDTVNTDPLDQAYLKQELIKFLETAAQTNEPFALLAISRSGITVLQDFTSDKKSVATAVRKAAANPSVPEPGKTGTTSLDQTPCGLSGAGCGTSDAAMAERQIRDWLALYKNQEEYEIFRDRNSRLDTLSSLQQIAQWLRGFPGRKTLVWAGSGVQWFGGMTRVVAGISNVSKVLGASQATKLDNFNTFDTPNQAVEANLYTFRVLSAANVAVYPLDARHNPNTSFAMFDVSRSDAPIGDAGFAAQKGRVQNDDQERITMFQQIAASTGGKPCFNRTDLANCLKEFAADSHDYYMLGFYVDKKTKLGWHAITLKLSEKAELRYRNGFEFFPLDPEKARLTDLQLAMMSPLPYTSLQFTGRFTEIEAKDPKRSAHFELNLPPSAISLGEKNDKLNFDVVAIARGSDGKEVSKLGQRITKTLRPEQAAVIGSDGVYYTNKLQLPAGRYGICIVVRDNVSGRIGSITTTLTVN